ncbi:MAG: RNA-binding S4 domain-containing protein [Acidimicrobiales bacterium]
MTGPADQGQPAGVAGVRVDKWLWGARLYKTRTAATDACRAGHVKLNRMAAKPATLVKPGDYIEARTGDRLHVLEVTVLIEKRAGAAIAAACYVDHSPAPPTREEAGSSNFARDRGTGRPTKLERRQLDRVRHQ